LPRVGEFSTLMSMIRYDSFRVSSRQFALAGGVTLRSQWQHYLDRLLDRFFCSNFDNHQMSGDGGRDGQRMWATVVYADIRDFAPFAEGSESEGPTNELNEYYAMARKVIDSHGGVFSTFGEDAILALFGAPTPYPDHPTKAVRAAVMMIDELAQLNTRRIMRGSVPIRVGIGVSTGEMLVGNLDQKQRQTFTAIGEGVNTAKRLSDLNKETPFYTIFVSESTLSAVDYAGDWLVENLGQVPIKGSKERVNIHALMPGRPN
jgi:adenylate cyclase